MACNYTGYVPIANLTEECQPGYVAPASDDGIQWYTPVIVLTLFCLSGLFSGLNLGLMSLDVVGLEIVEGSGSGKEPAFARALKKIRRHGNFLLCTLLLGNTLVNAVLAVFLAEIFGGFLGSMITTIAVVIFGEIIPQSVCSRHGLAVGFYTRYLVYFFMVAMFVVAYPIAWILDKIMGEEIGSVYSRAELKKLVEVHAANQHGDLQHDEVTLLSGALAFTGKKVTDVMTPMEDVFMLDINDCFDFQTMAKIIQQGYSRVPVRDGDEIVRVLLVKHLILLDPDDSTPVRSIISKGVSRAPFFIPDLSLDKMLNEFQLGKTHMAIVQGVTEAKIGQPARVKNLGIVTLEDVIEALIQEQIVDETDDTNDTKDFITRMNKKNLFKSKNMSQHEVDAVTRFLIGDVPELFGEKIMSESAVRAIVLNSHPLMYNPPPKGMGEKRLLTRGEEVDHAWLVLADGPLSIRAGDQGFLSAAQPWTILAKNALHKGLLTPDFDAVVTAPVRLLKIEGAVYQAALKGTLKEGAAAANGHVDPEVEAHLRGDARQDKIDFFDNDQDHLTQAQAAIIIGAESAATADAATISTQLRRGISLQTAVELGIDAAEEEHKTNTQPNGNGDVRPHVDA